MGDQTAERMLKSAERSLQAALAQRDARTAAALLRSAARYLDGAADAGESPGMGSLRVVGGRPLGDG